MRWPWVTRTRQLTTERLHADGLRIELAALRERVSQLDRLGNTLQQGLAIAEAHVDETRVGAQVILSRNADLLQMYDRLVQTVVAMKREGFAPQVNPADITTEPALADVVAEAIAQRAWTGTEMERALQKLARSELRREGVTPEDVATLILDGAKDTVFELG
jgi:hypothetical protein